MRSLFLEQVIIASTVFVATFLACVGGAALMRRAPLRASGAFIAVLVAAIVASNEVLWWHLFGDEH